MKITINQTTTGVEYEFFKLGKSLEIKGWRNK